MARLKSPREAPRGTQIHGGAKYKVYGAIQNIPIPHSHIRYTCQHVRFDRLIVHDGANHVIFGATPLLRTATPSRARHSPVRIARSRQRESLQSSPSDPAVAHTARRKMASKPSRQPPRPPNLIEDPPCLAFRDHARAALHRPVDHAVAGGVCTAGLAVGRGLYRGAGGAGGHARRTRTRRPG